MKLREARREWEDNVFSMFFSLPLFFLDRALHRSRVFRYLGRKERGRIWRYGDRRIKVAPVQPTRYAEKLSPRSRVDRGKTGKRGDVGDGIQESGRRWMRRGGHAFYHLFLIPSPFFALEARATVPRIEEKENGWENAKESVMRSSSARRGLSLSSLRRTVCNAMRFQ